MAEFGYWEQFRGEIVRFPGVGGLHNRIGRREPSVIATAKYALMRIDTGGITLRTHRDSTSNSSSP